METYYTTSKHDLQAGMKIEVNGSIELIGTYNLPIPESIFFLWVKTGMVAKEKPKPVLTIEKLIKAVCICEGVKEDAISAKCRKRELVVARQFAFFLAKKYNLGSYKYIGKEIGGKDHATVMHGIKTISGLIEHSAKYRDRLDAIERYICENIYKASTICNSGYLYLI